MTVCYRCGEKPFLKVHIEIIDGQEQTVCGRCKDIVCAICGKTKYKNDITRWTYSRDETTNEMLPIGSCCTYVAGKSDILKMGIDKYNQLKKSDPVLLKKLQHNSDMKRLQRQQYLNHDTVADNLIDGWARKKTTKKIKQ